MVREGMANCGVHDGTSYQFSIYAKRLEVRNVREIEPEWYPAWQIIDGSQKQPRNANDIIGPLERDIHANDVIQPAGHSIDDDDGRIICGVLRRMSKYAHFAPTHTELSIDENGLFGKEAIKTRVVGLADASAAEWLVRRAPAQQVSRLVARLP